MKNQLQKFFQTGFFHIFFSNVGNRVFQFLISIFIVRILSRELYGAWAYANNILNFLLLVDGLGVAAGVLQFCSSEEDHLRKAAYFRYAIQVGRKANLIIILLFLAILSVIDIPVSGSRAILFYLILIPLFTVHFQSMLSYLRSYLLNQHFSYLNSLNTFLFLLFVIVGGMTYGIPGLIGGRYLSLMLTLLAGFIIVKRLNLLPPIQEELSPHQKKEFLSYSVSAMLTNAISSLLYLVDTFLVGWILKEEILVGEYQVATIIPYALNFIPLSVMMYFYPYLARKKENFNYIKKQFNRIQYFGGLFNGFLSIILILFSEFVIQYVFGTQYRSSVVPFRILVVGYFITATFRIPAGNVLASMNKINVNLAISVISGVLNILLDIWFIKNYGIAGAAIATLIVFILSSVLNNVYLYYLLSGKTNPKEEGP